MASVFKQQCLALLDQVARAKMPLVITKHGKPVSRLVPLDSGKPRKSTSGSIRLLSDRDEDYFSTGETWDLESDKF